MENETSFGNSLYSVGAPLAVGAAGLYGLVGRSMFMGAMVSFGADSLEGGSVFKGSVFKFGDKAEDILKNTVRGYGQTAYMGKGGFSSLSFGGGTSGLFSMQGGHLLSGGLNRMTALNMVLPTIFTGIGTVNAMMDGGLAGGGEYLIQDFLGMDAMRKNVNRVYSFDLSKKEQIASIAKRFNKADPRKVSSLLLEQYFATGKTTGAYTMQRTILGMPMLGMMLPTIGGIAAAGVGMTAGKAVGEFVGKELGMERTGAAGMAGALFGGYGAAQIGAAATASLPRAAIAALGITAGYMISKGTYHMLSSGFQKERASHSKGLNFASDTSQFMTQRAVTMRQRAMQAMHKSHLNARSAFGQEATITHMNRDMFSHYKR